MTTNKQSPKEFSLPTLTDIQDWKELLRLYELGVLSYIDLTFAEHIHPEDEELAALCCYMLLSLRSGNLCVEIEDQHLKPDLKELIPEESGDFATFV